MNASGNLYIVATPIGNLQDITLRAIETLKDVDLIVCEDTRVSSTLLKRYEIKKPMVSLNEFNEEQTVYEILKKLETSDVALISDAGTPLISDPGFRLVTEARKKGFRVIPIPGPSALIAALCASALPTDKFIFLGFLSKSKGKVIKSLESVKSFDATIILYESPHRLLETLSLISQVYGDIQLTLARELTKIHEEIIADSISNLIEKFSKKKVRGEFVLLFSTKA